MRTVPCEYDSLIGLILFIAAVIGFGETGNTLSPINALAKEDLPALKAPNKATVKPL
jgi:hypothetical protein